MFRSSRLGVISALIAILASRTTAHTWIEEYQAIGENGSYIGDRGFSRGYIARTDPDFDGSLNSLWQLPGADAVMPDGAVRLRINSSDLLCHPSQRTSNYTDPRYPMLKAAPGGYVAMKYLENGHVTLPWNQPGKPEFGGTVLVYGTTNPIEEEKIADVMKWTFDGQGGDKRGRLLSAQNFDDGRCHQINSCYLSVERQAAFPLKIPGQNVNFEQWCETDLQIPKDQPGGKLTTYWVWQWPTSPGQECTYPEGKDEYYTTCADFEIEEAGANDMVKLAEEPATNTLMGEDFQTNALSTYHARTAHTTLPVVVQNWNQRVVETYVPNSSWLSACNSSAFFAYQAASKAGFPASIPPLCPPGKWATGTLSAFYSSKGIASAKSAAQAQQAAAVTSQVASTQPTAAQQTGVSAAAAASQTISYITVQSTLTTYYTSTITIGGGAAPAAVTSGSGSAAAPLKTVTTVGARTDRAAAVYVGTSGIAGEHIARHRAHARHFGA